MMKCTTNAAEELTLAQAQETGTELQLTETEQAWFGEGELLEQQADEMRASEMDCEPVASEKATVWSWLRAAVLTD